jgi:hypothetical protein
MNHVEPPPPPGGPAGPPPWPDKVVVKARIVTGATRVVLTRLADDQIRFEPDLKGTGTCVFTIEHYDLITAMSRWLV